MRKIYLRIGAASALVAGTFYFATHHGPYQFLEKFHPRHVVVDSSKLLNQGSGVPGMTMLVFEPSDRDAVLESLRCNLTFEKGYEAKDVLGSGQQERLWLFTLDKTPASKVDYCEGVQFIYGAAAEYKRSFYEPGTAPRNGPSCVVLISRRPTWIDERWQSLKALLHLP